MLTNNTQIPLSVAIWLACDEYNYQVNPYYISATELLKPIKSIILSRTLSQEESADIADLVASRLGTAVHNEIELAWRHRYEKAMTALGHPQHVIDSVIIDPDPGTDLTDKIPVYLERRSYKEMGKWRIGGKFDFVMNGKLTDYKTTKCYGYISDSNREAYINQGSIYRWLNQDIITEDNMSIAYILTDWLRSKAAQDPNYPKTQVIEKDYLLKKIAATENFVESRLSQIDMYTGVDQANMPQCTPDELWQKDSVWKYFKDPNKRTRSTKNFDNANDAYIRQGQDSNVGVVVEVKGGVQRCNYCNARPVCLQAEQLEHEGLLK